MKFSKLLEIVDDQPFFESGLLLAGGVDANHVRRQLSRWLQRGWIYQLRRGLYTLAPPYRKVVPHPFMVANELIKGSYVSCQSALAFYDIIPESMEQIISVCHSRPNHWRTPLGEFWYHQLAKRLMNGYKLVGLPGNSKAFVALPEKALLDLIYLQPSGDDPTYLQELRLQNLEILDLLRLQAIAERSNSLKLIRVAKVITRLVQEESQTYERLPD